MEDIKKVRIKIDEKEVEVPEGINLIEAAKIAGIEIPYYCYHPDLSIAGNCRMCQVYVEGRRNLEIACNTIVQDGMVVKTHRTESEVEEAQKSVLEFLLINHPLDCTVCDASGHCKLQDYHFEYNARHSRFKEDKVHKVKAKTIGPNVKLDAERCILCTRCVRFCDEITKTGELAVANRGDREEIVVKEGYELDNPLSGTVVDLCPVGALTHIPFRFKSRIWYAKEIDTICVGCSTGCNCRVAVRDNQVVYVKARYNQHVNKEWMCDEGRYGFHRFQPTNRIITPMVDGVECEMDEALKAVSSLKGKEVVVLISPDLCLEEMELIKKFLQQINTKICAVAYRRRQLTETEAVLISPDYASNIEGAKYSGLTDPDDPEGRYEEALSSINDDTAVLCIGERSVLNEDRSGLGDALSKTALSVGIASDGDSSLLKCFSVVFPERTVYEKSGIMLNKDRRAQYLNRLFEFPVGTLPAWRIINEMAGILGTKLTSKTEDRDFTLEFLSQHAGFNDVTIPRLKRGVVSV